MGPPHARSALVRYPFITPASALVKRNLISKRVPPPREVCLGAKSLYHAGVSLGEEEFNFHKGFLFTKADPGVLKGSRTKADLA